MTPEHAAVKAIQDALLADAGIAAAFGSRIRNRWVKKDDEYPIITVTTGEVMDRRAYCKGVDLVPVHADFWARWSETHPAAGVWVEDWAFTAQGVLESAPLVLDAPFENIRLNAYSRLPLHEQKRNFARARLTFNPHIVYPRSF